jgi:hypothetical protein
MKPSELSIDRRDQVCYKDATGVPVADYVFHYTSRQAAQDITCTRELLPGRNGGIYVSPDFHPSGAEAANLLSLVGKPVELVAPIPATVLAPLSPPSPTTVLPLQDPAGRIVRTGGGREVFVAVPPTVPSIRLRSVEWTALVAP